MVAIIDYGVGNIGSIENMLRKINVDSIITSDKQEINKAEKLILCGIGAFDDGMEKLQKMDIIDLLHEKVVVKKTPILGVCLGMQLFTNKSEEGTKPGLGYVDGEVLKFNFNGIEDGNKLRIPHMGWNEVQLKKSSPLFEAMHPDPRFYFVHSYRVTLNNQQDELLTAHYGFDFTAAFEKENIIGVQFHPEKSHKFGMKLYENFIRNY